MTIPIHMQKLIETFEFLSNWEDRYTYVIDLGRKLEPLDPKFMRDEFRVQGCTSKVWLVPQIKPGDEDHMYFLGDSDASIVKGLVAILLQVYSGRTSNEILNINIKAIFSKLGMEGHITPIRRNGFYSMVKIIQAMAKNYQPH